MPFGNEASGVHDRTTIFNFHMGIPHKHNDLRDDVQMLYDNDTITTPFYVSANDEGSAIPGSILSDRHDAVLHR